MPFRDGLQPLRDDLLNKFPKLNLVLKLGADGSWFINSKYDFYMPPITKMNPSILDDIKSGSISYEG